ncbi:hypothetical protein ACRAWF_31745, partial [Streptomyces sp. L7]
MQRNPRATRRTPPPPPPPPSADAPPLRGSHPQQPHPPRRLLPTGTAQWAEGRRPRDLITLGVPPKTSASPRSSSTTPDHPRIEALPMLRAALAATRETATLGTGALLPFLRRPVQTAQVLASIDLLSDG